MPRALVAGGGLAGLAAAAALADAGFEVELYEARGFLGGRATSFPLPGEEGGELIDNCQHVLLRCFDNLLDFYRRLGAERHIRFYREFHFVEPGGRVSCLERGRYPAPAHFFGSFAGLKFLGPMDKLAIARGMAAIRRERERRQDLDRITMLDWLREKGQTRRAIERFWRPVLVSAINEELDTMAARHGFQVFWLGFLARADASEMGLSAVPLRELYSAEAWEKLGRVTVHLRAPVECLPLEDGRVAGAQAGGERRAADYYICAVPFERLGALAPGLDIDVSQFRHSPITGIHLWFDRPVMDLPQATLLDRTIQWAFNKSEGRYVQVVVSASRSLVEMARQEVLALAVRELAEFFPSVGRARLERAQVIKEVRATFSARPGMEALRPPARTAIPNLFLAGDWTRTGWPATMEGAVRSGYLAAEAVTETAGQSRKFLLDLR